MRPRALPGDLAGSDPAWKIRAYRPSDARATAALFGETIRIACAGDYDAEQLAAWAAGCSDLGA